VPADPRMPRGRLGLLAPVARAGAFGPHGLRCFRLAVAVAERFLAVVSVSV